MFIIFQRQRYFNILFTDLQYVSQYPSLKFESFYVSSGQGLKKWLIETFKRDIQMFRFFVSAGNSRQNAELSKVVTFTVTH